MKTLEQFKNETLGGSYGKPRIAYIGDPWFLGECVSYVRQYMEQVDGVVTGNWGDAKDYWTNSTVAQYYEKVASPRDGDIVVWGDDQGTFTGPAGHIGIWFQGQILNQNYGGSRRVTLNKMFSPGLLGYLRRKGERTMLDKERVNQIVTAFHGVNANATDYAGFVGRPFEVLLDYVVSSQTRRQYLKGLEQLHADRASLVGEVAQLRAKLGSQPTTDAQVKLDEIKVILGIK